jgi:hypothetical protein
MSNIYTEYYCRGRGIIVETAWAHIIPLLEICVKKITGHVLFLFPMLLKWKNISAIIVNRYYQAYRLLHDRLFNKNRNT